MFLSEKKKKKKNEALGKLKRKKYFLENVFPNIFFFCLGLAIRLYQSTRRCKIGN